MKKYQLTTNPEIILDKETNTFIPKGNILWFDYEDWNAAGNTPEPADIIPEPVIPNWEAFNIALLTNPLWINWQVIPDLRTAIISAATTSNLPALQSAYNISKSITPPTEEAITDWQELANLYGIGVVF